MTTRTFARDGARNPDGMARRPLRAFTLIEMIVAIGAVALIAVGIAAVFESVGRTVAGGRRVSVLNQYAALMERQMRADFEAMTRDGVLLIRHEYAAEGASIPGHAEDRNPRPRRADQILFFVRGKFSSARTPLVPGITAEASEAMVHYGHGVRLDPVDDFQSHNLTASEPAYEMPQIDDGADSPMGGDRRYRDTAALGYDDGDPTTRNPNLYASEWTLLRKLVLLAPPGGALDLPRDGDSFWDDLVFGLMDASDKDIQVGGQPAASSVFRTLAARLPVDYGDPTTIPTIRGIAGDPSRYPALASGIVDVATTDLAEVRRTILDVNQPPDTIDSEADLFDPAVPGGLLDDEYNHSMGAGSGLRFIQQWMDDLWPTDPETGVRTRYELALPDYYGAITNLNSSNADLEATMRLADQRALGAGVFVPNCTEFIVEYTFGQVLTGGAYDGEMIWYGLDREVIVDGDSKTVVRAYPLAVDPEDGNDIRTPYEQTYVKLDGTEGQQRLTKAMLYSVLGGGGSNGGGGGATAAPITAHFGYNDPTYIPADPNVDPPTIPWPWPKLIRVTITLADPTDPSVEETFQFVFETPDGRVF